MVKGFAVKLTLIIISDMENNIFQIFVERRRAMDDKAIVEMYWQRDEHAIGATAEKYDSYCHSIAYNILRDYGDSEECVNDTYLKAWESIPPHKPESLRTFLAKITRNLSLDRFKRYSAEKRGGGEVPLVLDELKEGLRLRDGEDQLIESMMMRELLNGFIGSLKHETRVIFLRRYWYFSSVSSIASDLGLSESKVKMVLFRTRRRLAEHLKKEGYDYGEKG